MRDDAKMIVLVIINVVLGLGLLAMALSWWDRGNIIERLRRDYRDMRDKYFYQHKIANDVIAKLNEQEKAIEAMKADREALRELLA